jgi:hypothetical protein
VEFCTTEIGLLKDGSSEVGSGEISFAVFISAKEFFGTPRWFVVRYVEPPAKNL